MRKIIKATIWAKIKSVCKNLAEVRLGDIYKFHFYTFSEKKKALEKLSFGGDITEEHQYDGNDYTLSAGDINDLPLHTPIVQRVMDQGRDWRTRNACVVYAWYMGICNALRIEPDYDELSEFLIYFENTDGDYGKLWKEGYGASIPQIHKYGCKRWNELHPDLKVTYYRLHWSSANLTGALKKGYQAAGGYNTFPAYAEDVINGYIDSKDYSGWTRAGGHSLTRINGSSLRGRNVVEYYKKGAKTPHVNTVHSDHNHIIDNYPTSRKETNIYEHKYIDQHCENAIWYGWMYLMTATDPKTVNVKTIAETEEKTYSSLDYAVKEGIISNTRLDEGITRREVGIVAGRILKHK